MQLRSRDGQFVGPSLASVKSAAANAQWGKNAGFSEILTDQQGGSWPITGASFVLMRKVLNNPAVAQAMLRFFDWSYSNGMSRTPQLRISATQHSPAYPRGMEGQHKGWQGKSGLVICAVESIARKGTA